MYTAKYWITGINSEDDKDVKTYAEIEFTFREITSQKDRTEIKGRIKDTSLNGLESYLTKKGFSKLKSTFLQSYYNKGLKRIAISPYIFELGFNLNVEEKIEKKELEQTYISMKKINENLKNLNHFILTGEIK